MCIVDALNMLRGRGLTASPATLIPNAEGIALTERGAQASLSALGPGSPPIRGILTCQSGDFWPRVRRGVVAPWWRFHTRPADY